MDVLRFTVAHVSRLVFCYTQICLYLLGNRGLSERMLWMYIPQNPCIKLLHDHVVCAIFWTFVIPVHHSARPHIDI